MMAGQSHTTTDHKEIQKWVEARGGRPATVRGTGGKNDAGLLRIDFNEPDDRLEEISWEDFFAKFDENNLAFLYQDKKADGEESRFFKFVSREDEKGGKGREKEKQR
jgi:hypothetical protein